MKTITKLFILSSLLFGANVNAQYCMLPGRVPYDTDEPGITNFKLNTINRTSSNVESMSGVVVVTSDSTTLMRGHTYTVLITHSKDAVYFPDVHNNIRVWIDYNKNYSFEDAGETVILANLQTPGLFTGTFTVPATAPLGTTRLRATAKMSEEGGHTAPTACDSPADPLGYHGEMEDYKVTIIGSNGITETAATDNTISIYPNPATNQLTVSFEATENKPISIDLFDITGKLASHLLNDQQQSSLSYTFQLKNYNLPDGVYFIKLMSGSTSYYHRVLISQ